MNIVLSSSEQMFTHLKNNNIKNSLTCINPKNILTNLNVYFPQYLPTWYLSSKLKKYKQYINIVTQNIYLNAFGNLKYLKFFKNPMQKKLNHGVFEIPYTYKIDQYVKYLIYLIIKDTIYIDKNNFIDLDDYLTNIVSLIDALEIAHSDDCENLKKHIKYSICTQHLEYHNVVNPYTKKESSPDPLREIKQYDYSGHRKVTQFSHQYHEINRVDINSNEFYRDIIYAETVDYEALNSYLMKNDKYKFICEILNKIIKILDMNKLKTVCSKYTEKDCIRILVKYANVQFTK